MGKLLNLKQKKAVELTGHPLSINAGPGTGKTKTLVAKIVHLTSQEEVRAENILALTFTNKAANEIKERVKTEIKKTQGFPFIGTFHALGLYILNQSGKKKVEIIDEVQRKKLIRELISREDVPQDLKVVPIREVSLKISNCKNGSLQDESIKPLVEIYEKKLQELNVLDYDDLILKSLNLLKEDKNLKEKLRNQYKYILIDEFQDTNEIQYELIKLILNKERNICVIGDPLQSIYAFRGAKGNIFNQFKSDFPKAKEITLETNYRSTKNIIDSSHRLFPDSVKLGSVAKENGEVNLIETMNEYSVSDWILAKLSQVMGGMDLNQASDLSDKKDDKRATFSDFAIIYRIHGLSRVLEKKFRNSAIPFQIIGARSIYERKEIEVIINLLRLLYLPDKKRTSEFLESKYLGLTDILLKKVENSGIENWEDLGNIQNSKLSKICEKVERLRNEWNKQKMLGELVEQIIKEFEIEEFLEGKTDRINDLYAFSAEVSRFDKREEPLKDFLEHIEKIKDSDYYDERSDKVTLMTMHAAKGLEFKYVFICGFEQGLIPFSKKAKAENEIEEEKRLLYVAMTRAKHGLYLMKTKDASCFEELIMGEGLEEIRDEAIDRIRKRRRVQKAKKAQITLSI